MADKIMKAAAVAGVIWSITSVLAIAYAIATGTVQSEERTMPAAIMKLTIIAASLMFYIGLAKLSHKTGNRILQAAAYSWTILVAISLLYTLIYPKEIADPMTLVQAVELIIEAFLSILLASGIYKIATRHQKLRNITAVTTVLNGFMNILHAIGITLAGVTIAASNPIGMMLLSIKILLLIIAFIALLPIMFTTILLTSALLWKTAEEN
jgi:hypothetical protein